MPSKKFLGIKMKTKIVNTPVNREGFWALSSEDTTLPTPVSSSWKGRVEFLRLLGRVEKKARVIAYKGKSICRMCGSSNGSEEFTYKGWVWPSGYRHYIEAHQVRPSLAFEEFINKAGETSLN
jgi:hypothetical protein